MKFPKKLGACIDLAYSMRAARLELEGKTEEMRKEETALKDHILLAFSKSELEGSKGAVASASITRLTVPKVVDWELFYSFIAKHEAFELLERRPSRSAYKERLEAGVKVPGVEPMEVINLSLNKVG
jgi:hypothetical protein